MTAVLLVTVLWILLVALLLVSRLGRGRRALLAVPRVLRVHQPVQLPAVEEDPATVAALVHDHAAALVLAHSALALGARQLHQPRLARASSEMTSSSRTWEN